MFLDPMALHKFEAIIKEYDIKSVVETGTYHADSTLIFSYYIPDVYSIEIDPESYKLAKKTVLDKGYILVYSDGHSSLLVKGDRKIALFNASSPDWLKLYLNVVPERILFFLDAHGFVYWPILDELKAINKPDSVIIIHDFKVPDRDFGYDTWDGKELSYDFVGDDLMTINPKFRIEYNRESGGVYRGILYAFPEESK